MKCQQPNVVTPVDFTGDHLNIQVDIYSGRVWVCIDGVAVFRAKDLKKITLHEDPIGDLFIKGEDDEYQKRIE